LWAYQQILSLTYFDHASHLSKDQVSSGVGALISVCIPTFNGALYIGAQLASILKSPLITEVIVSDDGSADNTEKIVRAFHDPRIKFIQGPCTGLVNNYESLLSLASGEYIFLSDQDDVWYPNKVEVMLDYLQMYDMAVSDCRVVDEELNVIHSSFFAFRHSGPGIIRNLMQNSYLGCCISFRRRLLAFALPFPTNLPMHDWWLGLVAEIFGDIVFIDQPLMLYRRHGGNASSTTGRSFASWGKRFHWRISLFCALMRRRFNLG
jgi:glycosyltransferase involved in cell wall biosynthesis